MRRRYPPTRPSKACPLSGISTPKAGESGRSSRSSDATPSNGFAHAKLLQKDIDRIALSMQSQYKWDALPRPFQLAGVIAQLEGVDTVIQAPTGSGKTAVIAGPYVWPACRNMVTIVSVPIIALGEEMVQTFETDFGLKAVAINSKNGSLSPMVRKEILAGKYSVVIASPEMLQSHSFVKHILRNTAFTRRVLSLVVDEVHCVSHWGASFRKKYGQLGTVRAYLPANTPVIALTATLTARVRRDIQLKLHFNPSRSAFHNVGNDRPNVSIVVRACEHPLNTYADLDFVIPAKVRSPQDIPKTYIYVDNITTGNEIIDHLNTVLSNRNSGENTATADLPSGLIRPFNANLSHEYREQAMAHFRTGDIRILVCTDAAGMGCNIPDVDLVVQWKLPATFSNLIQRAGRTARGRDRIGLTVLLVERSAYSTNLCAGECQPSKTFVGKGKQKVQPSTVGPVEEQNGDPTNRRRAAAAKKYAEEHGISRGSTARRDDVPVGQQPPLNLEAEDEGLLAFVQSTTCRRRVWAEAFDNDPDKLAPTVPCCDICDPSLFDKTRPDEAISTSREKATRKGLPDAEVQSQLRRWRERIFSRDMADSPLAPSAVLDEETVVLVSSLGPLTKDRLSSILRSKWIWWNTYGDELSKFLETLDITFRPLPSKTRKKKKQDDLQPEVYNVTWGAIEYGPATNELEVIHDDVHFVYTEGTVVSDGTAMMLENNAQEEPHNPVSDVVVADNLATPSLTVPAKRRGRPRKQDSAAAADTLAAPTSTIPAKRQRGRPRKEENTRRIRAQAAGSESAPSSSVMAAENLDDHPGPSTTLPVIVPGVVYSPCSISNQWTSQPYMHTYTSENPHGYITAPSQYPPTSSLMPPSFAASTSPGASAPYPAAPYYYRPRTRSSNIRQLDSMAGYSPEEGAADSGAQQNIDE